MTREERAKQFAPFAALKGFEEALRAAECRPEEKICLAEDARQEMDRQLQELRPEEAIQVCYYSGGRYEQARGPFRGLDPLSRQLRLGRRNIPLDDLYQLRSLEEKHGAGEDPVL